jgi:DNA-binding response OmpR family regulator
MPKKVLIIEDSPAMVEIMSEILIDEGCRVNSAQTGKEGIAKAISEKPDIVVLDVMLPDINGIEVCKKIRESLGAGYPKIIIITGIIDAIDVVGAKKAGADDFCVKTQDMQPLKDALKKLI